ncbi:MAG: hypothetical protein M5U08_04440 [Burkholderiales bacterium]|nr:hypothetical protein [Burkholderiales bacterium]
MIVRDEYLDHGRDDASLLLGHAAAVTQARASLPSARRLQQVRLAYRGPNGF